MAYNLKDEADTKEYIDNLGTEYRFGCYHEKKPEVCHLLADFMEAIKQDYEKAGKLYKVNCEDFDFGHSCFKFGNYLFTGKGNFKPDHVRATEAFDKGCKLGFSDSCLHSGLMRTSKMSQVPRNHELAKDKFETGCSLDNAQCCFYLSGMFIAGIDKSSIAKDMEKAFTYSKKACELGNVYACANLSQMYKKGDGVQKDQEKADQYRKIALEMQDQITKPFRSITFEEGG